MDDESIGLGTTEPQAAGTCATCGRPLTQCGPNGECLRCLVSLGFLADGQEADRPAGRGRLTPGPLRYAHFEVEVGADGFPVELGAGAMAITYRARDTVLNSEVALKVIDRKVAQNPGARSRFLREARAAANIHHPNVARVTYYGLIRATTSTPWVLPFGICLLVGRLLSDARWKRSARDRPLSYPWNNSGTSICPRRLLRW